MLGALARAGRLLNRGLLELLYPGACWACAQPLPPGHVHFCAACHAALTADPLPTCPRCASTVGPFVNLRDGCTQCRDTPFAFERAHRLGPYDGLLRDLVLRLKRQSGDGLAEVLGELWADQAGSALRATGADVVIPVPLHWWRRLTR